MEVLTEVDRGRIEALRGRDEFFWLDLTSPTDEELDVTGELLGLHELALEDTREFNQRPKLDHYNDAVLLVYWSARVAADGIGVEQIEVHLHISGGFLVTVRRARSAELDEEVQSVQRRLVPQRDQFGAATEAIVGLPGLTRGSRAYLRDVGDHLAQVTGERYRQVDDLGALTSTYFNANANRLNRLATRLTVLATFFLIWTLVTSFFGQNFGWLVRHIDSFEAFVIYDGVGLVIPTILAAAFFWRRRREWL